MSESRDFFVVLRLQELLPMKRIAIAGFQHESNTFSAVPATWEKFERSGVLTGAAIRQRFEDSQSTLAGFLALGREQPGLRLEPLVFTRLTPMGALTAQARANIFDRILDAPTIDTVFDAVQR